MSDHEQTLRDAEKLLRLIGSPCPKNAQGADHEWHECPRCEMLHALEQRDSLARRLVLAGADALVRAKQTCAWTEDEDGVWHTGCGTAWCSEVGGAPADHKMRFCYHCGVTLAAGPFQATREAE